MQTVRVEVFVLFAVAVMGLGACGGDAKPANAPENAEGASTEPAAPAAGPGR